ncbi:MAG: MarR family transcriptional regulator [Candidatus Diapherotrites archaeon]|uniref:MarR family transcriptional regulator n=1 Tax=Candidatus Iainarchaeum sp. TaxID=3101447 RepID=A0A8T4L5R8_9ARCH|nr:MarR family transcriptional regulator [Candidatus Diapherotrites archaeon]
MVKWLEELDNVSRFYLTAIVVVTAYILASLVFAFVTGRAVALVMMNFSDNLLFLANVLAVLFSLGVGFVFSVFCWRMKKPGKAFEFIVGVLTDDEKRLLAEVKAAKAITQDSLVFRLGWSRAKASTVLSNLDRKRLVVRERSGKTYKVYLSDYYEKMA